MNGFSSVSEPSRMDAVQRFKCENIDDIFSSKISFFMSKAPSFPLEPNVGEILHYPNSQKGLYGEWRYGADFAGNSVRPT
jgi:hypothetical protein